MPEIKDFPAAAQLSDLDVIAAQRSSDGAARGLTKQAIVNAIVPLLPLNIAATPAAVTVPAFKRLNRVGNVATYAGGTIVPPGTDGATFLRHLSSGALGWNATYATGASDDLVLGKLTTSGGGTIVVFEPHVALGGDMSAANNLSDLASPSAARGNLGTVTSFTAGTQISAAGDTPVVYPANTQDMTVVYNVTASGAAYTRTVSVQDALGPQAGAQLTLMFNLASGAPGGSGPATVEVRYGNAAGPLLCSFTMGPVARSEIVRLVYGATTWNVIVCGPIPNAGAVALQEVGATRAPAGAIKFDGTASKSLSSEIRGISIGTGDYSAVVTVRVATNPDTTAAMGLMAIGGAAAFGGGQGELLVNQIQNNGIWQVGVRNSGGAPVWGALSMTAYAGRTVQFAVVRRSGVMSVLIDGAPVAWLPPATQAEAMASGSTWVHLGNYGAATLSYREAIYSFQLYNRALTPADLRLLAARGVAPEDRNATGLLLGPGLNNGGFETAGAGGADAFAVWTESATGASTVNRDTTVFDEGTASCRIDVDASASSALIQQVGVEFGRLYRVTGRTRSNRSAGSQSFQVQLGGLTSVLPAVAPQNQWASFAAELVSGNNVASPSVVFHRVGGEDGAGGIASSRWYDGISVERIGCLVDLDCGAGCAYVIPDLQSRYPALVSIAGSTVPVQHTRPRRDGQSIAVVAAAAGSYVIGALPGRARISGIVADVFSGGVLTVAIGTSSGASDIVALTAALPFGPNDLTLLKRYNNTLDPRIWVTVNLNSTCTFTILYDMVS